MGGLYNLMISTYMYFDDISCNYNSQLNKYIQPDNFWTSTSWLIIILIQGKKFKNWNTVKIFINHSLLHIPCCLRITQSIEKFLYFIWNNSCFDYHILNGSCSADSNISAWCFQLLPHSLNNYWGITPFEGFHRSI